MVDIYKAPQADLEAGVTKAGGSVEDALAGRFTFSIRATIREAWELISGFKGVAWLIFIIAFVIQIAVSMIVGVVVGDPVGFNEGASAGMWAGAFGVALTQQVIMAVLLAPISAGVMYIGLRRAAGQTVVVGDLFRPIVCTLPLMGVVLLTWLAMGIGFILLVLPGIYLAIGLSMASMLVVDKGMGTLEALRVSLLAINHCWFRLFGLGLLLGLILIVSTLPLLIGLIWAVPLAVVAFGVAYRQIFGVSGGPVE